MSASNRVPVLTSDGQSVLAELPADLAQENAHALVYLEDGRTLMVPADLFQARADGTYTLSVSLIEADTERWLAAAQGQEDVIVIPVVEEELDVQKRQFSTGGVRITKSVHERAELVPASGFREEVDVQRIPINRPVDNPLSPYMDGDTLVVPILEEVLVVEKRLVLKEELRVTKRRVEVGEPQQVTLRSEEVRVDPIPGETGNLDDPSRR
jgi:uncharacterized protein (TIGR02271 family)